MDFTTKLLTENNEVYTAPELFKNDEGVNDERDIELDFMRVATEALFNKIETSHAGDSEFNTVEMLEKRFDLFVKINESPENVELDGDEKQLLIDLVNVKFKSNVVIVARLVKELR